ncbi:hypothetical protein BRARA_B00774 [Brassica rapa]|uniref:Uncharacterized protein n=1 Tax=Brassica campestris TaxID=3711 RepID=A0A398A9K0_BRACM|nr:hypothetical protein BRARA_B00774 [Brassica rapa]
MKCNCCWKDLEGQQAVYKTCDHHLFLTESSMKAVDINPNDDWVNMAMTGVSPRDLIKCALRSVTFYISQRDREMQHQMNKLVDKCNQKCEDVKAKIIEKLEQAQATYHKMHKRHEKMQEEVETLKIDIQELQEKFYKKAR